jgi:hypothetical protein
MTSIDEVQAVRKRRRLAVLILLAGTAAVVGLFAYYGSVVYQARGYEGFVKFSKFVIPILVLLTALAWIWELRAPRSDRRK